MRHCAGGYSETTVTGQSEAACIIASRSSDIENYRNVSITQATREKKLERIIFSLSSEEFSVPDWNYHGAKAVKKGSISHAFVILNNLPKHFPLPEVMVEPTGDIGMDWATSGGELAASVDENGVLSFACLSAKEEETFGSGKIGSCFLPKNFLEILNSIY